MPEPDQQLDENQQAVRSRRGLSRSERKVPEIALNPAIAGLLLLLMLLPTFLVAKNLGSTVPQGCGLTPRWIAVAADQPTWGDGSSTALQRGNCLDSTRVRLGQCKLVRRMTVHYRALGVLVLEAQ
jgi:hypothetical protein